MNIEQARFNMIEQQIRPWDVLDPVVLGLLAEMKRERYVPEAHRELAFADLEIPIGEGQAMWQPKVEARVLQELEVCAGDAAYEVGTGSGYFAALLAKQARHVTSVEIRTAFVERAKRNLQADAVTNVTVLAGDAGLAPLGEASYDVIVLGGSTPVLPQAFLDRLNPGGRLFAVVGDAPVMKALLVRQAERGDFQRIELFETQLPPLDNALQPARFHF